MTSSHVLCQECGFSFTKNRELPDGLNGFMYNMIACKKCAVSMCSKCEDALTKKHGWEAALRPGKPCSFCNTSTDILFLHVA